MKSITLSIATMITLAAAPAFAWENDIESDPFQGSEVYRSAEYADTGLAILKCDTSGKGFDFIFVTHFDWDYSWDDALVSNLVNLESGFAVDGDVVNAYGQGYAYPNGNGKLVAAWTFVSQEADALLEAMAGAQTNIYVMDGVLTGFNTLPASGSTSTANHILECLSKQGAGV